MHRGFAGAGDPMNACCSLPFVPPWQLISVILADNRIST
jgi:hypothetical protein